eukprot:CAMPEP_0172708068 /NCGR_PEP_ID=MMETSP1074-20121228/50338_1 /TAXON_ID=2916 /ORGANISM="Ceratium fusus, Strain PA161109" /LENGTH=265 /DNA_ID=CAMNT_0013530957 /DNA_START=137 /DNA_END=931 /DNA_ORIENTATION=-
MPSSVQAVFKPSKTVLAVHCIVPGRTLPTTRFCVDNRVRLRDVLSAWAEGVMKVRGGHIPSGARVVGTNHTTRNLDIDASLKTLRPSLPVKDGGLTVSVFWPEEKLPAGGLGTSVVQLASPCASPGAPVAKKTTHFATDWAVPLKDDGKTTARDRGAVVPERGKKRGSDEKGVAKRRAVANVNGVDHEELAKLVQKLREANNQADNVATKAKKEKKRHREVAKTKGVNKLGSVSKRGKFAEGAARKSRSSSRSSSSSSSSSSDSE